MTRALPLLVVLSLIPAAMGEAAAQAPGPYAGQQARGIKALSAQEQADLLAGRGMGLARAAELNHYPGPAHVLELRDKLGLTPRQARDVQASFERMGAAARTLGAELVERERRLDAAFASGKITPASLARQTADIAGLQGRLRAVHLGAHLETRAALAPGQVAAYDALRGYAGAAPADPAQHHGMRHD